MRLPSAPLSPALSRYYADVFKFIFAALLIALAFAATYTSSPAAFSEADFRQIVLFGLAVNVVLLLVAALLHLRFRLAANVFLTLVALVGAGTAYIIHTDLYLTGNRVVLILLFASFSAGLFVAFQVIDQGRWAGVGLAAAALVALGIIAGGQLAAGSTVKGDVANVRDITFQDTPNLYFISFDGVAPLPVLNRYLDLETTEFHDLFEANFRRFPNFFSNSVNTAHSLNTLFSLDVDIYTSLLEELQRQGAEPNPYLIAGQNPSPLLNVMDRNGYETTAIYVDNYFGSRQGPYIDHYITFEENTACNLLDDGIKGIAFWGYCRFFDGSYHWDNQLTVEQITKVNVNGGPQFVMAHLYAPGHAEASFRYDNAEEREKFGAKYLEESEKAAGYLESILGHLQENDPNAILFVYSDHGALLSQGLAFRDAPAFVVQDNYGILGGVYPPDACAAELDEASVRGYMTTLDAAHALLRCLSGGASVLIDPPPYTRPAYGPIPWEAQLDYKEFLYE